MGTELARVQGDPEQSEAVRRAGEIVRAGGLVAFPTETVYGLGADALRGESARRVYAAKGRPSDNPLIVHVAAWEDVAAVAEEIPAVAETLARRFWPGPLTLIFQKREIVPRETTGGLPTVAVRLPDHPVARALIRQAGGFVAAPSANLSGRPSPTTAGRVAEDLDGRIDMILDGGPAVLGIESTILDLSDNVPTILRPGFVTAEELSEAIGEVRIDPGLVREDLPPKAPGMKYRHYAPRAEMIVVLGEKGFVTGRIAVLARELTAEGKRVGIFASAETAGQYRADLVLSAGAWEDAAAMASCLYESLRRFDDHGVDCILSEGFEGPGVARAVLNRLLKAAGQRVIRQEGRP